MESAVYLDIHTHLTHEKFAFDLSDVIQRAESAGVGVMVVNGLEPISNRQVLQLATQHASIQPALGIYPIDAVNHLVPEDFPHRLARFVVDDEIAFIREQARSGKLVAIGECGLDGHWLPAETFAAQERVFLALLEIAADYDLPAVIHTRKLEQRAMDILAHHRLRRVNFHCFGGKVKLALAGAEQHGWYFSIPANAANNEAFTKMLKQLPAEKILTETDAPYLAPVRGERNEPANVVGTVAYLAKLRGWDVETAKMQVWKNFQALVN